MLNPESFKALTDRIVDVVGEHSLNYVVIAEIAGVDEEIHTAAIWRGGINTAMGLCDRGLLRMKEVARRHDFGMPPRADLPED